MDRLIISTITASHLSLHFSKWTLFRVHRLSWARAHFHTLNAEEEQLCFHHSLVEGSRSWY